MEIRLKDGWSKYRIAKYFECSYDIMYFADKINNLPRKILNYHTPEELFEKQLDLIYAA